jgi:hypothetical protein
MQAISGFYTTNYIIWLSTLQSLNIVFIHNITNLSIEYLDYNCSAIFLLSYLQPVAAEHLSKDDLISWENNAATGFDIVTKKYKFARSFPFVNKQ